MQKIYTIYSIIFMTRLDYLLDIFESTSNAAGLLYCATHVQVMCFNFFLIFFVVLTSHVLFTCSFYT